MGTTAQESFIGRAAAPGSAGGASRSQLLCLCPREWQHLPLCPSAVPQDSREGGVSSGQTTASSRLVSCCLSRVVAFYFGAAGGLESLRAGSELFGVLHHFSVHDASCSLLSRCWVSPLDRRCPQRLHSRWAVHPEPAAAAAAGAGAAVAAPGRLRQPPGDGGWAPGAEKLPQHPSPSSHSLCPLLVAKEPREGGSSDLCKVVAARTGRERAYGELVAGAPNPNSRRPPPPLWPRSAFLSPSSGRACLRGQPLR